MANMASSGMWAAPPWRRMRDRACARVTGHSDTPKSGAQTGGQAEHGVEKGQADTAQTGKPRQPYMHAEKVRAQRANISIQKSTNNCHKHKTQTNDNPPKQTLPERLSQSPSRSRRASGDRSVTCMPRMEPACCICSTARNACRQGEGVVLV